MRLALPLEHAEEIELDVRVRIHELLHDPRRRAADGDARAPRAIRARARARRSRPARACRRETPSSPRTACPRGRCASSTLPIRPQDHGRGDAHDRSRSRLRSRSTTSRATCAPGVAAARTATRRGPRASRAATRTGSPRAARLSRSLRARRAASRRNARASRATAAQIVVLRERIERDPQAEALGQRDLLLDRFAGMDLVADVLRLEVLAEVLGQQVAAIRRRVDRARSPPRPRSSRRASP